MGTKHKVQMKVTGRQLHGVALPIGTPSHATVFGPEPKCFPIRTCLRPAVHWERQETLLVSLSLTKPLCSTTQPHKASVRMWLMPVALSRLGQECVDKFPHGCATNQALGRGESIPATVVLQHIFPLNQHVLFTLEYATIVY